MHKTSPQIAALRSSLSDRSVAGMAFTGIRASESAARAEYDDFSDGAKHKGQRSRHVILDWNSAELFNYIYQEDLLINDAYKKGCGRVGCLICPMSSSKNDFFKYYSYAEGSDRLIEAIKHTSGKTYFSDQEMLEFIDRGNWKSRRTGKELNIGSDIHVFELDRSRTISIIVQYIDDRWAEWAKTIGAFSRIDQNQYVIEYKGKNYEINLKLTAEGTNFTFPNAGSTKDDIKFVSLFRSVMIKSLYCVNCGVCVANCPNGSIEMGSSDLKISDSCTHCHLCHNINNHCLRYASIRNPKGGDAMTAKSLDRYYTFGIRKQWMDTYIKYSGTDSFWNSDGDGSVPNKKKSAFKKFLQDASIIPDSKTNTPTEFGQIVIKLGSDDLAAWALMICNLVYSDAFRWYIHNVAFNHDTTPADILEKLKDDMPKDTKGLGKRNYISAFKVILYKTPIGNEIGLGHCDASENDKGEISLRSITRTPWNSPDPKVILYSLYKFAEACGGYYQFSLSRLLDHDIESDGISPTEIFGIDRETMAKILNGLSVNYPGFINASFTHNLDTIDLRSEKTSLDVLKELF